MKFATDPIVALFALSHMMFALFCTVATTSTTPTPVIDRSRIANATLRYISGGIDPVLSASTPGMLPDVPPAIGIEDGTIVIVNKTMHLFPTELSDGWTKTRVVHWTAPTNDRLNWTFVGGITPHGHGKCGLDDHHAELWSGSPQWQAPGQSDSDPQGRWYMSVVGYMKIEKEYQI